MNRREVIAGLATGIALLPWRATAEQTARAWRVGMLSSQPRPPSIGSSAFAGFVEGMRELGAIEGRDYIVAWRFAGGQMDRLPALAAERLLA